MRALCSHRGGGSAVTEKIVVLLPVACVTPPASTHGVWAHVLAPEPVPQSLSTVQGPNLFVLSVAWVVQSLMASGSVVGRVTVWYMPVIAAFVESMGEHG